MSLNIFNFNLPKINFKFNKNKKKKEPERVATFHNEINIDILKDKHNYLLDLSSSTFLIITYPSLVIKLYYNNNCKDASKMFNQFLTNNFELKDFQFLFIRLFNKIVKEKLNRLSKNLNINGRFYCINIFPLFSEDNSIYAFVVQNSKFTNIKVFLENEI